MKPKNEKSISRILIKKKGEYILSNKPGLTEKKKIISSNLKKKAKNIYGYKNPGLHQKIKTVFQGFWKKQIEKIFQGFWKKKGDKIFLRIKIQIET